MTAFWQDLAISPFLWQAVVAALLASVSCGIIGSFVVVQRTTYIAGAISHCVLAGMGLARYLQVVYGVTWFTPLMGATAAALLAACIIGGVMLYGAQRQDTVLSAIWAIGMAMGLSFIHATPGYAEDLMSYLFGNIQMVARRDLYLMAGLNVIVVTLVLLFYNKFLVISFHEELARLRGIRIGVYRMLLLLLTALTVVLLTQVVGLVMVIALLTLPAATSAQLTGRLWGMMLLSIVLTLVFSVGGLAISYAPNWSPGATIIELAGGAFLLVLLGKRILRALRQSRTSSP